MIRQATLLDLLTLAPLAVSYGDEALGHDSFPFDLEHCLSNMATSILDDESCLLIAVHDGKPLGCIWGSARALPWSKAKLAFDTILYVIPEKRKTSVGYKLMQAWEQWATEHDAVEVQISIASGIHEDSSVSFFKKLGYHYIGQQFRKEVTHGIKS